VCVEEIKTPDVDSRTAEQGSGLGREQLNVVDYIAVDFAAVARTFDIEKKPSEEDQARRKGAKAVERAEDLAKWTGC